MTRLNQISMALALGAVVLSPLALVSSADAARMTTEQRAAYKAKQTECKAKAKEQRLHFRKRSRFIRECMKG
jgi:predicted transcriptional regulator